MILISDKYHAQAPIKWYVFLHMYNNEYLLQQIQRSWI